MRSCPAWNSLEQLVEKLGTAVSSCEQLGTAGSSWELLGAARSSWEQLGAAGGEAGGEQLQVPRQLKGPHLRDQ